MSLKVGIDVGGTFTDFLVCRDGDEPRIFKVLTTPSDPSVGLINGLNTIASSLGIETAQLARDMDTIVHGTTVTTNAVLTNTGAKTCLLTTHGVRDALEMRRGIREEQYNNRYTNVVPLVPRHRRIPVRERLNYRGDVLEPLDADDLRRTLRTLKNERIEAVAVCFMNAFANADHEQQAAAIVREEMPDAYLTVSSEFLPSIRFYDRLSSTVLNSYVGPELSAYLDRLVVQLREIGFGGVLLVMQSNGGVTAPQAARRAPAHTLLSGPAAGPEAALGYVRCLGQSSCITIDMGGTSFDAALVREGASNIVTQGQINRHRIALPMMDIVTIGAGGGSIGWIDAGGLLRMGPQSAAADPGPACYDKGGTLPTCTDADLALGYLDADFFAGGAIKLNREAAERAIDEHIARPLGLSIEDAAAGMVRVINAGMARGVREISVKRGFDAREFPVVAAGGAGPLHACMICGELDIPMFIVPRESSILCAAGMLMSDLRHDFVSSFVALFDSTDWQALRDCVARMVDDGTRLLTQEDIPQEKHRFAIHLECRYVKQYHEVAVPVSLEAIRDADADAVALAFHVEHERLYGYSLEEQRTPIELINVRVNATGLTEKPVYREEPRVDRDPGGALKAERKVYIPEEGIARLVPVYDGHKTRHGHHITGPAVIEQINTTLLLTAGYDCTCDKHGSFVVYRKGDPFSGDPQGSAPPFSGSSQGGTEVLR